MSNKLETLNIDGNEVTVAELPKSIRDVVDTFDRVRSDMDELAYQINVLNHAAISLNNKIAVDTTEYFKKLKEVEEARNAEVEDAPTEPEGTKKAKPVKK